MNYVCLIAKNLNKMKINHRIMLSCLLISGLSAQSNAMQIDVNRHQINTHKITPPIKSWKTLRDDGIVKQDLDYSCGAASLATILNNVFYQNTTEEQLLTIMDKGDFRASFADMQQALQSLGFQSQGLSLSFDTLKTLKIPAIVYVKHRNNDHFSVIRGINSEFVWLADPSMGNRILSKEQFLAMWQTQNTPFGKALVIIPNKEQIINNSYFSHNIKQPTRQALSQLKTRL